MPEQKASETKRGGDSKAEGLESVMRSAVDQFGTRAVGEAFSRLKSERQAAAADEARQAIIDLTASGQLLTLAAEREIIEQTGVDRRTYQGVLNRLIWRRKENEGGILDFNGYGFGTRVTAEEIAEKFRQEKELLTETEPAIPDVAVKTEAAPISDFDKARARQFVRADVSAEGATRYEHLYMRALKAGINRFAIQGAIRELLDSGAIVAGTAFGQVRGDITDNVQQPDDESPRQHANRFINDVLVGVELTYQELYALAGQAGVKRFDLGEELDRLIRSGEIKRQEGLGLGKLHKL